MKSANPNTKKKAQNFFKNDNYRMSAVRNKADKNRMDPAIYESQNQELKAVLDYDGGVITQENRDQVLTYLHNKREPSMTEEQIAKI